MQVYLVIIETPNSYSYSGTSLFLEKIFATKEAAEKYIEGRKRDFGYHHDVSFHIDVETVEV